MENQNKVLIIVLFCVLCSTAAIAQDLSAFEVVDNASVGLDIAPFSKAGMAIADIDGNGWQDIFCLRWGGGSYSRIYINENGVFHVAMY